MNGRTPLERVTRGIFGGLSAGFVALYALSWGVELFLGAAEEPRAPLAGVLLVVFMASFPAASLGLALGVAASGATLLSDIRRSAILMALGMGMWGWLAILGGTSSILVAGGWLTMAFALAALGVVMIRPARSWHTHLSFLGGFLPGIGLLLGPFLIPGMSSDRTGYYREAMRSDLRSVASAQDAFRERTGRYAGALEEVDVELSPGVELVRLEATAEGWEARVTHLGLDDATCSHDGGTGEAPAEPPCQGVPDRGSESGRWSAIFCWTVLGLVPLFGLLGWRAGTRELLAARHRGDDGG